MLPGVSSYKTILAHAKGCEFLASLACGHHGGREWRMSTASEHPSGSEASQLGRGHEQRRRRNHHGRGQSDPLGVQRIACSTARRAYQTAELYGAALGLLIRNTPRLRELDHGEWEGRKAKELLLDPNSGYAKRLSDPKWIAIPGGDESVQGAQQRAADAVREGAGRKADK